jgi:hypothetical protein
MGYLCPTSQLSSSWTHHSRVFIFPACCMKFVLRSLTIYQPRGLIIAIISQRFESLLLPTFTIKSQLNCVTFLHPHTVIGTDNVIWTPWLASTHIIVSLPAPSCTSKPVTVTLERNFQPQPLITFTFRSWLMCVILQWLKYVYNKTFSGFNVIYPCFVPRL